MGTARGARTGVVACSRPFWAWAAPAGMRPLAMPVLLAGRLNTTQCVKVPLGASGSSMIMATLPAADGMPVQDSGMGVLLPRQENLAGIFAPAANAGLRTVIAAAADGAGAVAAGAVPPPLPLHPASKAAASAASAPLLPRLALRSPGLSSPCPSRDLRDGCHPQRSSRYSSPMSARFWRSSVISGSPSGRMRSRRSIVSRSSARASPYRPSWRYSWASPARLRSVSG
jgi:hypothetical protein